MESACLDYNCFEQPTFCCSCHGSREHYCSTHIEGHKSTSGQHNIKPLMLTLDGQNRKAVTLIIKNYKNKLEEARGFCKDISDKIIQEILNQTNMIIETLNQIERNCEDLVKKMTTDKKVDRKTVEYFSRISIPKFDNLKNGWEKVIVDIQELFKYPSAINYPIPLSINDQYIFYFDENFREFSKIELQTLVKTVSEISEELKGNHYFGGCRLDDSTFFLHSGTNGHEPISDAVIYDLYLDRAVPVCRSNHPKNFAACVLKNNKVYAFGSTMPHLLSCEYFDLSVQSWQKIPSLPSNVTFCTASTVRDKILITGSGIASFWEFCPESQSYSLFPEELSTGYKVLCENFLITSEGLVEINYKQPQLESIIYPSFIMVGPLAIVLVRRFKKYLYYVDSKKHLMRIDTQAKKLEEISCTLQESE